MQTTEVFIEQVLIGAIVLGTALHLFGVSLADVQTSSILLGVIGGGVLVADHPHVLDAPRYAPPLPAATQRSRVIVEGGRNGERGGSAGALGGAPLPRALDRTRLGNRWA